MGLRMGKKMPEEEFLRMVVLHSWVTSSMERKAIPSDCKTMSGEKQNGVEMNTAGNFGVAEALI